jgi:hypothetical protein
VISAAAVVEAAAAKPAMLFSSAVLTHVHPEELSEFFGNVMTIVGPGAQAVFKAYWNDSATIQYSGRSWAHALPVMRELVEARDGALTLMTNEEHFFEGIGQTAKKGWIRIARRA